MSERGNSNSFTLHRVMNRHFKMRSIHVLCAFDAMVFLGNIMNQTLIDFINAGLPVLPVSSDKKPMIYSHKFLDIDLPTVDMYNKIEKCNFALKTGNRQTKIECIDFDVKNDPDKDDPEKAIWIKFKNLFNIENLYCETTPSGGYHLIYKCDIVGQSQKLAYCKGKKEAVIETRGNGGYVVVSPSTGYNTIQGDIFNLPFISLKMVEELKSICLALNECPDKTIKKTPETHYSLTYNKKHSSDVLSLLISDGWTIVKEHPDRVWVRRPGKDRGISGTVYKMSGVFYCFTSATQYNPSTAYSPYHIVKEQKKYTEEQMERIVCNEIGESYIKDLISEILINTLKLRDFEIKKTLYEAVISDMGKKGKFYRTIKNGNNGYYFYNKNLYLCEIKNGDFCCLMFSIYGLTKTEGYCKKVYEDIKNFSLINGEIVEMQKYSYYNTNVYVDNFNGSMFKISDKDIYIVDNGTDGVLFLKSNNQPVVYILEEVDVLSELFGEIKFSVGNIEENEYRLLFIFWIISFYFMSMNKPICVFFGEKGSGKSFIFKKVLYLLFGNLAGLKTVPEKKENFTAIVTNNKFVVFDNADTARPWLNDSLATAATGGCESMRELYTTNDESTYIIDCFIGLTSRTPKFTRDDIADRLLLFPVERLSEFKSEEGIVDRLMKNRDIIMSCIFNQVKIALQNINKPDFICVSRMGSFENFCRKIKPETNEIFKKLISEQKDFSEDVFTEIFFSYCKNQTFDTLIKTPQELSDEMTEICKKKYIKMIITPHAVGYKLKKEYDFVEIEKQGLPQRKTQYKLKIKCELKNFLG